MSTSKLRVAVIGIGPAGLTAADVARNQFGCDVHLFARSLAKSTLYGCQYLHAPIVPTKSAEVEYKLLGTADQYRQKVYGDGWNGQVSPEDFIGSHFAWDLRDAYSVLWKEYIGYSRAVPFTPLRVTPSRMAEVAKAMREDFDLVLSTVPANALCCLPEQHTFAEREIYAIGDAPELGISVPLDIPDNTIMCNGEPEPTWYRASKVFGYATMEWPGRRQPPYDGVVRVGKPLWTNCDCFAWVERIGRYGAWRKDVLVHDVYEQVKALIGIRTGNYNPRPQDRRNDVCERCGRISYVVRPVLESAEQEYRCLDGHVWAVPNEVR